MATKIHSHVEEQGFMERKIGRTFFRRLMPIGERKGTPLFLLHGGPGSTHEPFSEVLGLSEDREVVIYDQIGCGRSDRIDGKHWTLETFVQELEELRVALGYKKIDILGHSWGTMLGAEYYFTYPRNVRAIVFSSPCLSAKQWTDDAQRLLKKMSPAHQKTVAKALKAKTYDGKAFAKSNEAYYAKHVSKFVGKGKKTPHVLKLAVAGFALDGYMKMWGPVEYVATGSLKTFDRAKDLPKIKVPTLFTCGLHDEATPETVRSQARTAPGSKFHLFKRSSHLATLEEPKEYMKAVRKFLISVDGI